MSALTFPLQLAGPASTAFVSPVPTQQCQVSDGGVSIVVQVLDGAGNPVGLRGATGLQVITVRPSGLSVATPAAFYTNGFDGQMYFETGSGTPFGAGLLEHGVWQVQGKLVLNGSVLYTSVGTFQVNDNLGA